MGRKIVHSATDSLGFRDWCRTRYQARTEAAERLARAVARDPAADSITSRDHLRLWLRHGPRLPAHARAEAAGLWQGFAAWRRAQDRRPC